jgi:hypothetical protein
MIHGDHDELHLELYSDANVSGFFFSTLARLCKKGE